MSKRFPTHLLILALLSAVLGIGIAATVILNRPATPQGSLSASPITRAQGLQPGQPAPDFSLPTLDGEPVALKDYRGKKVLVNFWASWCGPCKAEAPDLQSVHDQLKASNGVANDAVIIGIGLLDKTENLKAFVQENKLTYTLVEDSSGTTGDAYRVLAMPVNIFINRDGTIHKLILGTVTKDSVLKTFDEMK